MGASLAKSDLAGLARRYRPALIAFFLRRTRDPARAEDLTQEVFIRLSDMTQDDVRNVEGYLFQIARNLLRDTHRRDSVRAGYAAIIGSDDQRETDHRDAERIIIARQTLENVARLLERLPERTRSIFILHRMEAMSRTDIARAYGISVSAVEKHLGKVMALLMTTEGDL